MYVYKFICSVGISDSNILSRLLVTYSTSSVKPRSDFLGSSLSFFVYYYFFSTVNVAESNLNI